MITLCRLDERLIHGQIAIKWSRVTGVSHIIVANDAAAASPIIQKSLLMAAPGHLKCAIVSVEKAVAMLNSPKAADNKVLLLVKNPDDMLTVLNGCPGIQKVNVGNYGRVEPKNDGYERKTFGRNLYADDTEIPKFQAIAKKASELGVECVYQTTPEESAQDLGKLIG